VTTQFSISDDVCVVFNSNTIRTGTAYPAVVHKFTSSLLLDL